MTWVRLDDNAPRHPKIASLSDKAFRWWVLALCFAGEFLTDGVLPPTFWKQAPKQVRAELTNARLWDWDDPNFQIHDYLKHQTSREAVESERRRQRERRSTERGTSDRRTAGTTAGTTTGRTEENPPPEDRRQKTEDREQNTEQRGSGGLIVSPEYYERRKQHCAFVGSKIEVPNGLHAELRKSHGGLNPEKELQGWYLELNEQAENEAWRIPQEKAFYSWFKGLYGQKFPAPAINGKSITDEIDEWANS